MDEVEVRPDGDQPTEQERRGPLAWMARNAVAANILMVFLVIGGLFQMCKVKKEVFPEFELDLVLVNIPYPGASPEEVEQGVLRAAEEAIRGIDGVKEVRSTANEGIGVLVVELLLGTDSDQALDKVQSAIDRVTSFPDPVKNEGAIAIFKATNRSEVVSMAIYGEVPEESLRQLAERTKEELLQDKRITYVTIAGTRPLEISVEVPQRKLRELGMTTEEIAGIIRQASVELPGGEVKTPGGGVLVKTAERRDYGTEFAEITLVSQPDGTVIKVGDVAEVIDAFADVDTAATFDGKPAVMVKVFRTGDQSPTDVSEAVHEYIKTNRERFEGVEIATWFDMSEFYQDRIELLNRNALLGLLLVLLVLGLFLEIKLAFWVTIGIPITFIGAFFFLPSADVSINMISLFAFIVVLGMVVDDAIIVGESIYKHRQDGHGRLRAAILGARDVALPVTFAIITTIFAFMPMLFVPGPAGKFFRVIPIVVISVFILSLIESLFILPAHLAHSKKNRESGVFGAITRIQSVFANGLERFIEKRYQPLLRLALSYKGVTMAVAFATFLLSVGYCTGGRIQQTFLPKVDSDVIIAEADLPFGAPVTASQELLELMIETANETLDEFGGDKLKRGLFAQYGAQGTGRQGDPNAVAGGASGSHLVEVALYLVESDERPMTGAEFSRRWRAKLDQRAAGLEALRFRFATGPSGGKPVHIELSHPDQKQLEQASAVLATRLADFTGTYDIDDGFALGKPQLEFKLRPEARSLGVTELSLARQIRSAFFGAEAVPRQQRQRDEIRVYVRLPESERDSEYHVERLMIRTPSGGEIPLAEAAEIVRGRAYTEINRVDARRTMTVSSEVDLALGSADKINSQVAELVMPELVSAYPGLVWSFGGEQREQGDVNKSLFSGFAIALIGMFALLAVSFRSYLQPLIVLLAIPFGFVGALWGHVLMGYDWSLMSLMGIVALSGIVINDSLILVVAINRYRAQGMELYEAVVAGGMRRFRPILLTSLTTFFGLAPMILETSVQARFLIPMAVSLGFGVMAATFITLLLVPAGYVILEENIIGGWKRFVGAWRTLLSLEPDRPEVE